MKLVMRRVQRDLQPNPWHKRASEAMERASHPGGNEFDFRSHWAYATMGTCVGLVSLLAVSVYVIIKRRRKAGSPLEPTPPKQPSFRMPPLKIEAVPVLRPQPHMGRLSMGMVLEPVQRVKARGLLERRGSTASLTIDLAPAEMGGSFQGGSPPKECSTAEYLSSAGNRMTRKQLRASILDPKTLHHEFIDVPLNHPAKLDLPGCSTKNRYKSIWPNPSSMVTLPPRGEDPSSAYINANYIRGYDGEERAFIATQGPLPGTLDDFWSLVWTERSPAIVMMTKLREKNRVKCENYLPVREGDYGNIHVMVVNTVARNGYHVKDLLLQKDNELRQVKHYWFTGWPDGRAPVTTAMHLLQMANEVDTERLRQKSIGRTHPGPVVVHCSAGIGRTGCFIGTYIGMWQLREENMVDILGIVCQMRLDRGGMIQTPEQYEFLHHVLRLFESELADSPPSPLDVDAHAPTRQSLSPPEPMSS